MEAHVNRDRKSIKKHKYPVTSINISSFSTFQQQAKFQLVLLYGPGWWRSDASVSGPGCMCEKKTSPICTCPAGGITKIYWLFCTAQISCPLPAKNDPHAGWRECTTQYGVSRYCTTISKRRGEYKKYPSSPLFDRKLSISACERGHKLKVYDMFDSTLDMPHGRILANYTKVAINDILPSCLKSG